MRTIKERAREILMDYNENAFLELEKHYGEIIELTYNFEKNYLNKYDLMTNNYFLVIKTKENICLVIFSGLYYKSTEPEYETFAVDCKYIKDLNTPFPIIDEEGIRNDLEYDYNCDIKECLYKNGFYEGDIEYLIEKLEKEK